MLHPSSLSWFDVAWRLGAATLFPLIVGLERFFHKKPIDFRPFVIISVAACGLLIGSIELLQSSNDSQAQIDPTRVIEGVITGIGFIGAGAMFREGNYVQGAGSAASIWCAGAIGLVCGMGELWLGAIVSIIVLLVLIVSRPFTERWDPGSTKRADTE
jgi:putative Mg2+ transporter-C (MgtC) family protein